jgi:SAM-dependent methyltransferase
MAQNIYDDPEFLTGYSQLPRQILGLDGAPEWPALRALLPDVRGKRVVDLGCGFGWASRWMRDQGAASVLGLDVSQNMIARARQDTADLAVDYEIADLDTLSLPDQAFDLAFSSLTFHYVADFGQPRAYNSQRARAQWAIGLLDRASDFHGGGASVVDARRKRPQNVAGERIRDRRRTPHGLVRQGRAQIPSNLGHDAEYVD